MRSVIYREARGFNGRPGDIIVEVEDDVPPRIGDIVEFKSLGTKARYVVETLLKEVYSDEGRANVSPDPKAAQTVWIAGVTRLHEGRKWPVDDEAVVWLRTTLFERESCNALAKILELPPSPKHDIDELLAELLTRLS